MKEDDSNWFSKWEEQLPSLDELMPLSQTLITPDLAFAFDITNSITPINNNNHSPPPPPPPLPSVATTHPSLADFGDSGGDEPARTLKRPRLVWTPQLHKRFVDAVAHLGIKNAVPKTIMQLMSVDGLTRENVASHLQKYRLYLKRMQGISGGSGGGASGGGAGLASVVSDPATDHLFASSPIPPHFLHPTTARVNSEHFLPFVPVGALQQHHHQMAAAAAQYHHRQVAHFGSPPNGQFEHPFLVRPVHRIGGPVSTPATTYRDDLDSGNGTGGRKVLTLFPTGNN